MGGTTSVINATNITINMALCVVLSYYEANEIKAGDSFKWEKIGAVWYSVVNIPWAGPSSEFSMGQVCSIPYTYFEEELELTAKDVAKYGHGTLGYLNIIGRNLTYNEAADRLQKLGFFNNGYYVQGKTLKIIGGPSSNAVSGPEGKTVDITEPYDKVNFVFVQ